MARRHRPVCRRGDHMGWMYSFASSLAGPSIRRHKRDRFLWSYVRRLGAWSSGMAITQRDLYRHAVHTNRYASHRGRYPQRHCLGRRAATSDGSNGSVQAWPRAGPRRVISFGGIPSAINARARLPVPQPVMMKFAMARREFVIKINRIA